MSHRCMERVSRAGDASASAAPHMGNIRGFSTGPIPFFRKCRVSPGNLSTGNLSTRHARDFATFRHHRTSPQPCSSSPVPVRSRLDGCHLGQRAPGIGPEGFDIHEKGHRVGRNMLLGVPQGLADAALNPPGIPEKPGKVA